VKILQKGLGATFLTHTVDHCCIILLHYCLSTAWSYLAGLCRSWYQTVRAFTTTHHMWCV